MRYFFDTEFIERGPEYPIRFLSIGIVAEDGREIYLEHPHAAERIVRDFERFGDDWLTKNVLPHLRGGFGFVNVRGSILTFCDPHAWGKPEFWAYFADYDWVVFCQLFGRMIDLPKGWPMYCLDVKQLMKDRGVTRDELPPSTNEHDALEDARWAKRAWLSVTGAA